MALERWVWECIYFMSSWFSSPNLAEPSFIFVLSLFWLNRTNWRLVYSFYNRPMLLIKEKTKIYHNHKLLATWPTFVLCVFSANRKTCWRLCERWCSAAGRLKTPIIFAQRSCVGHTHTDTRPHRTDIPARPDILCPWWAGGPHPHTTSITSPLVTQSILSWTTVCSAPSSYIICCLL